MSPDVYDLADWVPESESWVLRLQILAGPSNGPGEESFDLTVCSIPWMAERVRRDGVLDGRHHLIVERYDWSAIRAFVERRVQSCEGREWSEVAVKLARFGYWEFENYRP